MTKQPVGCRILLCGVKPRRPSRRRPARSRTSYGCAAWAPVLRPCRSDGLPYYAPGRSALQQLGQARAAAQLDAAWSANSLRPSVDVNRSRSPHHEDLLRHASAASLVRRQPSGVDPAVPHPAYQADEQGFRCVVARVPADRQRAVPYRQLVGVHHHARREDQLHVAAAHPQLDDQLGPAAHRAGQVQHHVAPRGAQRQPVRQRPPAVAAYRAVFLADREQFGGRLGGHPSERQRECAVAAWRRDQIGGERGQRVDRAGGQRRVQPLVEFDRVESAVGDGGAQQFDDSVAVRVGRA
jgi:hypothetical protein